MKKLYFAAIGVPAMMAWAQAPPPPHGGFGHEMRFLGIEGMRPGQVVKGAAFSGKEVTTETQTLADGTHIQHTTTAQIYRDAEGRTRIERTFSSVGPWAGGEARTIIDIVDPVAGVAYNLNPEKLTAMKMTLPPPNAAHHGPGQSQTAASAVASRARGAGQEAVKSELGAQTIQGLAVQGTLFTRSIAVGQVGNDQPLTIRDERWYSPDLQMNLQTKHVDPRMGEVDTEFQNISRSAPDASLFVPPSNYTITARPAGGPRRGGPGFGPPPPAQE